MPPRKRTNTKLHPISKGFLRRLGVNIAEAERLGIGDVRKGILLMGERAKLDSRRMAVVRGRLSGKSMKAIGEKLPNKAKVALKGRKLKKIGVTPQRVITIRNQAVTALRHEIANSASANLLRKEHLDAISRYRLGENVNPKKAR
tara:strand:+ start:6703 stop:7137 length:435 start_codon:yes stop_codon:yes gene_type:complete